MYFFLYVISTTLQVPSYERFYLFDLCIFENNIFVELEDKNLVRAFWRINLISKKTELSIPLNGWRAI